MSKFNEMHRLVHACIDAKSGFEMMFSDIGNTMSLRLDDLGACSRGHLGMGGVVD